MHDRTEFLDRTREILDGVEGSGWPLAPLIRQGIRLSAEMGANELRDWLEANLADAGRLDDAHNMLQTGRTRITMNERHRVVQNEMHRRLVQEYIGLKYGDVPIAIFEAARQQVDSRIAALAPEAAEAFSSVYSKLESDVPEEWSTALTSCRRLLQSIADILYPARDTAAGERGLLKEKYMNRFKAFVDDHVSSESDNGLWSAQADALKALLDAVYQKANKGTHSNVTLQEARRAVLATYLLIGDLLELVPGIDS